MSQSSMLIRRKEDEERLKQIEHQTVLKYGIQKLALAFLTRQPFPQSIRFSRSLQLPNSTPLRLVVCNWPRYACVPPIARLLNFRREGKTYILSIVKNQENRHYKINITALTHIWYDSLLSTLHAYNVVDSHKLSVIKISRTGTRL